MNSGQHLSGIVSESHHSEGEWRRAMFAEFLDMLQLLTMDVQTILVNNMRGTKLS